MNLTDSQNLERHLLCSATDLAERQPRGFRIGNGQNVLNVLVLKIDGQIHAFENTCPHTGVPLDWGDGRFMDLTGAYLQCSTHGALFRLDDGYCVRGPCARQSLKSLAIRIDEGLVYLLRELAAS